MIRSIESNDIPRICQIYNHYIANTVITFEESAVTEVEMKSRVERITEAYPWLVAIEGDQLVGYAYAARWKERSAYRYSAESTIYLSPEYVGRGIGTALYQDLFARLAAQQVHAVIAGIALPNPASVALHEKLGFHKVAHLSEVGWKFAKWIDVAYWERTLLSATPE